MIPDTNVCCPMVLLDLVLRCDEHDLHRVMWTDDLLEELVRVWVRNGAKSEAAARTIVQQIESTFRTQRIPANEYQRLVCEMPGNDPDATFTPRLPWRSLRPRC